MYIETVQMCTTKSQGTILYFPKNGDTQTFWSQLPVSFIATLVASQTLQDTSAESQSDTDYQTDSSKHNQSSEGKLALYFNNKFDLIFVFHES